MTTLIGISGSLRAASFNTALLRAAAEVAPAGVTVKIETIKGIPLYDADVEAAEGVPGQVSTLKDAIAAADGLLIVTPEYNNSTPGVLKNALDWLTRPPADSKRVWSGRPVAVIGATPGGWGTLLAQSALLPFLRTVGARHWTEGRLAVSKASEQFEDGVLKNEQTRKMLETFVAGFADFASKHRAR